MLGPSRRERPQCASVATCALSATLSQQPATTATQSIAENATRSNPATRQSRFEARSSGMMEQGSLNNKIDTAQKFLPTEVDRDSAVEHPNPPLFVVRVDLSHCQVVAFTTSSAVIIVPANRIA
jgi:hypothetical protein